MKRNLKTYEGMFLLEAGKGTFETASEPVRTVLTRGEAEILSIKPWDERKLAYEIGGHKRGLYVLAYFRADPARIAEMEHDCRLGEQILRALILHRPALSDAEIAAPTPATAAARRAESRRAERLAEQGQGDERTPDQDTQEAPKAESKSQTDADASDDGMKDAAEPVADEAPPA